MRKINIAVVDSNYKDRRKTLTLLDEYTATTRMRCRIDWFNSGSGILDEVRRNGVYDLYLIEPMLPDINGIRVARDLRKESRSGKIVFISETQTYAFAAFEVRAFDYVSKTASKMRFFDMLDNAFEDIINNMVIPVFELELQSGYIRVPADSISHVDIVGRALCYHMTDGKTYLSKCLRGGFIGAVDKLLDQPWFVMSGVSHLINVSCITVLYKNSAIMSNGETVPITHASYPIVRKVWSENRL